MRNICGGFVEIFKPELLSTAPCAMSATFVAAAAERAAALRKASEPLHAHEHSHEHGHHSCCDGGDCSRKHAHDEHHEHSHNNHGSAAMHALIDAFTDAFNDEETMPERMMKAASKPPQPPKPSSDKPKGDGGPPQLGSILQLVKETGKTRKECKAALISSGNDYDAARWSLMPEPPPDVSDPAGGGDENESHAAPAAVPGLFEPSAKFAGGRPGWLYKRGPMGTGYYRDAPLNVCAAKEG